MRHLPSCGTYIIFSITAYGKGNGNPKLSAAAVNSLPLTSIDNLFSFSTGKVDSFIRTT